MLLLVLLIGCSVLLVLSGVQVLQDRCMTRRSATEVQELFEEDFGQSYTELFTDWQEEPIAAASLAQVRGNIGHSCRSKKHIMGWKKNLVLAGKNVVHVLENLVQVG